MKYYILKEITAYLNTFKNIKYIKRVDNNTIKIEFSKDDTVYFDLSKSNSLIYQKENNDNKTKEFLAPFDVILQKRFTNAKVQKVYLLNDDKIIRFELLSKSAYKSTLSYLQLEFTGKYTNIIILDENEIVLEALRHIDEWSSVRVVKVGSKLSSLEKPEFKYEEKNIEDIKKYLLEVFNQKQLSELNGLKKQKISSIKKSKSKIVKLLNSLEDVPTLQKNARELNEEAQDIVSKLYQFEGYEKQVMILKSNDLFRQSKKNKQKANHQYLEEINLKQKINYYERLEDIISACKNVDEIEFYFPKKDKNQIKTKKANPYQEFFFNGYKIMLGRDERENIYLLQNSKASDYWFHLQGQVSSHVIVSNTKKTIPQELIEEAAKICARFSVSSGGVYSVDFTQRRNVKIQTRANVLYNPYSTVVVKI